MKKITFFLTLFFASFSLIAQTSFGGIVDPMTNAGTAGGSSVTYIGHQAGLQSSGVHNTFLGFRSGFNNTSGRFNICVGGQSGLNNSTGLHNTFVGLESGRDNLTGSTNTYLGSRSGRNHTNGSRNTFVGFATGQNATAGANNTYLGSEAGFNARGNRNVFIGYQAGRNVTAANDQLYIDNSPTNTPLIYGNFATDLVSVRGDFLVGGGIVKIGDPNLATPGDYKLFVEDGILTEKVKVAGVNSSDWADFVFEEDYKLNSIAKVEDFIKTNKHLPNVPSAKEVSENGVEMVKMDATLLRQIEELWLHTIELKKEIQELKANLNAGK